MHEPRMESRESEMGWIISSRWFAVGPERITGQRRDVGFLLGVADILLLGRAAPIPKKPQRSQTFHMAVASSPHETHGRQGS